jgi:hypothetical protein
MLNHDKCILRPHLRINLADVALRDGRDMRRFSTQYPAYQRHVHSHLPSSRWGVQSGLPTKTQRCTCIALSQITCSSSQTGNVTTRNARLSTVVKFTICSIVLTQGSHSPVGYVTTVIVHVSWRMFRHAATLLPNTT